MHVYWCFWESSQKKEAIDDSSLKGQRNGHQLTSTGSVKIHSHPLASIRGFIGFDSHFAFLRRLTRVFCQKSKEPLPLLSFVRYQRNDEILGNKVRPVAKLEDFLILANRGLLGENHAAGRRDYIGGIDGRLDGLLVSGKLERTGYTPPEHLDSGGKAPRVL